MGAGSMGLNRRGLNRRGLDRLGQALAAMGVLVLPPRCGGCGRPDTPWCAGCRALVAPARPVRVAPTPLPEGFPRAAWAAVPYEGAIRRALVAYKDDGRRDLRRVLAPLLAMSVRAAVAELGGGLAGRETFDGYGSTRRIVVVPVPSSAAATRRRGDAPLLGLVAAALPQTGDWERRVALTPRALRTRRAVRDQAGLTSRERAANLSGALCATSGLADRQVILVDDVVTTGATLAEAAAAASAAGALDVVAACLAATRRRATSHA